MADAELTNTKPYVCDSQGRVKVARESPRDDLIELLFLVSKIQVMGRCVPKAGLERVHGQARLSCHG